MKNVKKIISSFLCVVLLLTAAPLSGFVGLELPDFSGLFSTKAEAESYSGACGDNLTWSLDATTGEFVVSGTGNMVDYDGIECTPWWDYCSLIKKVTIDSGVTGIGANAFAFCSVVTLKIKDAKVALGRNAFYSCTELADVSLGRGTISIGDYAFAECTSLADIYLPEGIQTINECAFGGCVSLENITIPKGVSVISDLLFYNCTGLTSITIPDSVKSIGNGAFYNCDSLTTVYYTGSQSSWDDVSIDVGNDIFKEKNIIFDSNSERPYYEQGVCGDNLFWIYYVDGELKIYGTGEMADYSCDDVPWSKYSSSIRSVIIGKEATSISDCAFAGCISIKSITIPDSITSIGGGAFQSCTNLTNITIPDSVTSIGDFAFDSCSNLEKVVFDNCVANIGCAAFYQCTKLRSVSLGKGIYSIGDYAFNDCHSLETLVIPSSVVSIGETVFFNCFSLKYISVELNNIEYSSDDYGVLYDKSKTRVIQYPIANDSDFYVMPESVTTIGEYALAFCNKLQSVVVPESVINIDATSFEHNYGRDDFVIYGYPRSTICLFALENAINFKSYTIISLDGSGAELTKTHIAAVNGQIVYAFPKEPILETKTFTGWYDTPDGGTLYTAESVVNEDITLYANWTDRKIQKQTVITPPAKTSYFVGDEFVLDGYEVEIEYDNGYTKTYNKDNLTVLASTLTEAGEQTVSVQADEFVVEIPVEVIPIKASSISVSKLPAKTEYITGQKIDTTGLELKVVNNNGTIEYVTDGFELVDDAVYSVGINDVLVTYQGITTSFQVNVAEILPATLSVSKQPDKTFYSTDEEFESKGLELTVTYNNGTTKVLSSLSDVNIEYDFSSMNPTVTFSYTERGKTLTCTLDIVVYESPEISLENASVEAGGTVGIPVHIIGNCGLMGFKFQMTYNADIFVPQSITWTLDSGNKEDNIGSNPSGAVDIVWSGDENYTSDGLLFTVNFNVADNTVGDFDFGISYSSDNVYNEEEELVKLSCTGSTINVVKPSLPDVMTIYIDPVSTENGTQIDVPVNLHKNTGLGVSVINIVYDSNALTPVSVTSGMSTVLSENLSSANGNLQIILLATDAGLGDGTLFNIKFDVSDNAAGEYPLTLSCVGQTTQNGLITVNNASLSENTKIYADDVIANNGETVRIPVYISNNHGVMGMNIRFRFDPDILRPINVTKGNALTSGTFDSGILTDENTIVISWFDSSDFNGNGEIAILEFEVLAEGVLGSFIEVTYSQDDTFNEKWEDVILDCSNINVVVTSDLLAAKPGTTTIIESGLIYGLDCGLNNLDDYVVVDNSYNLDYNGNTVLGTGSVVSAMLNGNKVQDYNIVIFGDVNGDGWCDGMDAVIVSCLADGMLTKNDVGEAVYMAADCNFDGTIDSADVELLQEAGLKQKDISQTGKTKVVTISLNANGGSVSGKTVTAYVGNTVGTLPVPTREHYTFVGWFTSVSGGTEVKSTTILSEANDVTLYARWSPVTYTVELNANGGSCSTDSETVAYDSIYGTLPIPTKTGYTFNGWYTAVSGGTKITEDTKVTTASNHTLYAQWSVNSYIIAFNGNGSTSGSMSKLEMKYGTAKRLTANTFAKTGYSFNGWNTNSDGSGTSYADEASVNNLTSTNGVTVTLYAQWNANTGTKYVINHYQMNVSGSGYTLKETENKTGTTASSVTIANLKKTYAGFTYEGGMGTTSATATKPSTLDTTTTVLADGTRVINIYYSRNKYALTLNKGTGITAVSGSGTYYYGQSVTIDATVAIGYTWSKWSENNATKKVAITMPANALTLTANATLNSYTISYTLNGGTVATANPTSYNVTTADFTLNNPTRTGYTFAGWTGTGLSAATKTVTVAKGSTGNRSYTATWTANTYIVTFDANGGSCSTASKSVTYDSTYGTLPTPTRTGYTFTGWYTASSSGTKITADTKVTVTANQKLYAQWTENGYTIVFNGNGATSGSMTNLAMTYGTSKNLTANAFAKTNYSFNGWNTKADGSGTTYADKASINNLTSTNGATVTLYATWKLKTVSMPSYIGWYYTDAQTNLKNLGLNVTFNYAYNYNYAYGVVYAQNYAQGTILNYGTTVTLTYSLGAKPYAVGDRVWFDGGSVYKSVPGTYVTKESTIFIITDLAYRYNGVNYYGIKYEDTSSRFGWVAENLIHQVTN